MFALSSSCLELRDKNGHHTLKNVGGELELSLMTFNILSTFDLTSLTQGYPLWMKRKSHVFEMIRAKDPDLISIQEASSSQLDQFQAEFSQQYRFAHNRAFTPDSFVMYKSSRFDLIEKGYWALEAPLDLKIRRLAVWVKLRDKNSSRELMFVGTHLDAKKIKMGELKLIKEKLRVHHGSGAPLFLAGDFNSDRNDPVYAELTSAGWKDSYLGPLDESETKTFPYLNPTRRIDHIVFFGEGMETTEWEALLAAEGITPSDHRPVFASFKILEALF